MAGLYIHIPFCLKKCPYCDFYSLPYDEALVDEYISSLLKELSLYRISEPIETIYFGGGTPSVLKPAQIERIINRIVSLYKLTSKPEVSLEANPETLNRKVLEGFLSSGINRLSLGIQSLQDHEL
ncbi:MAG: radical SAM protein, partial [Nitrospirae bacterium]